MSRAQEIISKMSLDDKAMLLSQGLIEQNDVTPYGIESFYVADGPSGIRKREEISRSRIPLICFPSTSTYSCSWDKDLMRKLGNYLGVEAKTEGIDILFGPGCNIKRSPLGGRNFEYYSEDPVLTGELATEYIKGIQAVGTGACVKHYAANNQETNRMSIDEQIDDRTLHELYLKAFEKPIREGKPYMVMTGYNKINGEYCANNREILKNVLRGEWGYEGNVITDCVAAHDLAEGIKNGLNLQLSSETKERLVEEIKELLEEGKIQEADVDAAVENTINLALMCVKNSRKESYNPEEHHSFAAEVAEESMVLLKNENAILPLQKTDSICVIGKMAEDLRFQGCGSAHVVPYYVSQIYEEIKKYNPCAVYKKGYDDEELCEAENEFLKEVQKFDKIIFCMGLPESYESEGYDRTHMKIPEHQESLLRKVAEVNSHIIVVLLHGSPVEMPWVNMVEGILDAELPGEAGGEAIGKILFGEVNPSGKLTETYPNRLQDTPSYLNFPGKGNKVRYAEGIYVGYRYYDKRQMEVLFPFGYGLSYTQFSYREMEIIKKEKNIIVSFKIKNTGKRDGKEIVQLYVQKPGVLYDCPVRELVDFKKIFLKEGEEKEVIFLLSPEKFQVYDEKEHNWVIEGGMYQIEAGASSRDIRLVKSVQIEASGDKEKIESDTTLEDIIYRFHKGELLEKMLKKYPISSQILRFCYAEDCTMRAMQLSNTMETLKRSDSMITDKVIYTILGRLNEQN